MSQEAKILGIIGVISIVMVIAAVFFLSGSASQKNAPVDSQVLSRNNVHQTESSGSAKITVVEFADFQCPACGQVYPILKSLKSEYQGRVNFVYRHFPLPQHKNAILAAKASEAASKQGKFWEMHDLLFENQSSWSESDQAQESFVRYATQLGLNQEQFTKDLETVMESINSDLSDGRALGVNSTPTIYINGIKYNGGFSAQAFKQAFDAALQK